MIHFYSLQTKIWMILLKSKSLEKSDRSINYETETVNMK